MKSKKKKTCDYRRLNNGEIDKLKKNGEDPEDIKGYEPKLDLFKCHGSGKVAVGRKPWHQDDDGEWVPGGTSYDDTCINIDVLPWPRKRTKEMDKTIIEFRIGGLTKPIEGVLKKLPIPPDKVHRKGEKRGNTILTHKEDWFLYSAGDTKKTGFEKSIATLVDRLHANRQKIQKACGQHSSRLSCIFYFAADDRPLVYFSPESLTKLTDLRAAIDVNLYPLPSGGKQKHPAGRRESTSRGED